MMKRRPSATMTTTTTNARSQSQSYFRASNVCFVFIMVLLSISYMGFDPTDYSPMKGRGSTTTRYLDEDDEEGLDGVRSYVLASPAAASRRSITGGGDEEEENDDDYDEDYDEENEKKDDDDEKKKNDFGDYGKEKYDEGSMTGPAFCMLIKDDNDILDEWIGYHYHTMKMRKVIVAVDPNSVTDPWDVLEKWTNEGSDGDFDLDVTMWYDDSFIPDRLWKEPKNYTVLPFLAGLSNMKLEIDESKLEEGETVDVAELLERALHGEFASADLINKAKFESEEEREHAHAQNNHKIRQQVFIHECFKEVKRTYDETRIGWTVHIDTDEYMVPNPWIGAHLYDGGKIDEKFVSSDSLKEMYPTKPTENSLMKFFTKYFDESNEMHRKQGWKVRDTKYSKGCVYLPRILFGATDDDDDSGASKVTVGTKTSLSGDDGGGTKTTTTTTVVEETVWNHTKFESLRWKYHQDHTQHEDRDKGYPPKGMIDVSKHTLTSKEGWKTDTVPVKYMSIHRVSNRCLPNPNVFTLNNNQRHVQPLVLYHYLGSLERYMGRPGDHRRDPSTHVFRNGYATKWGDTNRERRKRKGKENDDDDNDDDDDDDDHRFWIGGWFESFVRTHGIDATRKVFGDRFSTTTTMTTV